MKSVRLLTVAVLLAAIAASIAFLPTGPEWLEAAETRLRLLGEVLPQATIRMSSHTWSANGTSLRAGRQRLVDLEVSANTGNFAIRLASQSARTVGAPCLIDGESGGVLRYRLSLGAVEVEFVRGEAPLVRARGLLAPHGPSVQLDIDLPSSTGSGRYEERLVLVIVAS